ncbi:mismatch repair protein MLH1 [Trypanosoma theileri]|uniref:Mismatch repair protein MLH1 n=1 Tax=Trypanosoma theileri TaxID=67003 RepID=A0A1X0NW59_9TRYP|nr:mismatch repair protein MLH1 [Trypanosoma theileri]ORC88768.1 mismatch repair protein MLH1 [Trypanosoma theileri]
MHVVKAGNMKPGSMRRIERLPESVVNRIAAGEVVQRPSAALKELLENALDAGSTCVQVLVQGGGLEVLQVSDDGNGIHYEDLPLLCERYATSKLRVFEDLTRISSFGFRGEALSSISYVARVTVTTMRRENNENSINEAVHTTTPSSLSSTIGTGTGTGSGATLAWRCHYVDGIMQGKPKPCAGNPGTCIRVEKMFYNAAVRRRALNKPSEEYSRIVAVLSRYALAFPTIAFSCRREEASNNSNSCGSKTDIFFPKNSTTLANIRLFYGAAIASHLHELKCAGTTIKTQTAISDIDNVLSISGVEGEGVFLISGYTSDVALVNRKPYLCVFVNNRLVESSVIKRAIDTVYSGILVGGNRPFTVLFITVPPDRVDVNIHPTKHEVCLLDEEIIVARLSESVREVLMITSARRQIDTRQMMSKAVSLGERGVQVQQLSSSQRSNMISSVGASGNGIAVAPCTVVRVEPQRGALDAFMLRRLSAPEEKLKSEETIHVKDEMRENGMSSSDKGNNRDDILTVNKEEVIPQVKQDNPIKMEDRTTTTVFSTEGVLERTTETETTTTTRTDMETNNHNINTNITSSLVASIMKLGTLLDDDGNTLDDEMDEEDGAGYVMQHFKRHRKEIQEAVGMPDESSNNNNNNNNNNTTIPTAALTTTTTTTTETVDPSHSSEVVPDAREDLLLTSVATIVSHIRQATSPTAQSLFEQLTYVGVLNNSTFLAQSGTTLYAIDTLRLVRLVVYQRIFLRWAVASLPTPPQVVLRDPIRVSDLLCFAIQHDVQPKCETSFSEEEVERTIRRMDRRLRHWRCMLMEYFAIEISEDGHLLALPFGLNASWPPVPRVIPLFIWKLAAEVPYGEDEVECFTAIAQHIANTLYGLSLHDSWMLTNSAISSDPETTGVAGVGVVNYSASSSSTSPSPLTSGEQESVPSYIDAIRFGLVSCATSVKFFIPPADILIDGSLRTVVSVEELYKVFERC